MKLSAENMKKISRIKQLPLAELNALREIVRKALKTSQQELADYDNLLKNEAALTGKQRFELSKLKSQYPNKAHLQFDITQLEKQSQTLENQIKAGPPGPAVEPPKKMDIGAGKIPAKAPVAKEPPKRKEDKHQRSKFEPRLGKIAEDRPGVAPPVIHGKKAGDVARAPVAPAPVAPGPKVEPKPAEPKKLSHLQQMFEDRIKGKQKEVPKQKAEPPKKLDDQRKMAINVNPFLGRKLGEKIPERPKAPRPDPAALHRNIEQAELRDKERLHLLTSAEINLVKQAFEDARKQGMPLIKIKRAKGPKGEERKDITELERRLNLPYSVILDSSGEYYALYRGKTKLLGEGGFGRVKLAQNLDTGEWVALKIQRIANKDFGVTEGLRVINESDYLKEAGLGKGVALRDLVTHSKRYDVEVLLNGNSLVYYKYPTDANGVYHAEDLITEMDEKLMIALAALKQVKQLHDKNILHRDIKPLNFMYDKKTGEVTLIDFGIAVRLPKKEEVFLDKGIGTRAYLAPEIFAAAYKASAPNARVCPFSRATDVYALGLTLQSILLGEDKHHPMSIEEKYALLKAIVPMSSTDPAKRPPIEAVIQQLEALKAEREAQRKARPGV